MRLRRFSYLFVVITAILSIMIGASVKPTNRFYINDYANIISKEYENYIYENSLNLYEKTGAQIVVTTVDSLEGQDIETYSLEMARNWAIGSSGSNNGVLLLLAVEDRKVRIEVGYGLEGILPDGKTGRILDEYGVPYFKDDKFETGLVEVYKSLFTNVAYEYDNIVTLGEGMEDYIVEEDELGLIEILFIVLFVGGIILVFAGPIMLYGFLSLIDFIFKTKFTKKVHAKLNGRRYTDSYYDDWFYFNSIDFDNHVSSGDSSSSGGSSGGGGSFGGGGSSRGF